MGLQPTCAGADPLGEEEARRIRGLGYSLSVGMGAWGSVSEGAVRVRFFFSHNSRIAAAIS
jgi:hypothetical protein